MMAVNHPNLSGKTSPIEQLLGIRRVTTEEPGYNTNAFTHTSPLQCPPWARGAYGGHIIALALLAGYETVPPGMRAYSMYCDFFHAADVDGQLVYTVHRTRDSKTFASRRVEAKHVGKIVSAAIISFTVPKRAIEREVLGHSVPFPGPETFPPPPKDVETSFATQSAAGQGGIDQPCDCIRVRPSGNLHSRGKPHERKFYQWMRARGKITGGIHQQLAALAYMSDNYFIGTTFRAHGAARFANRAELKSDSILRGEEKNKVKAYHKALEDEEIVENPAAPSEPRRRQVDWVVTLDHAIYFHDVEDMRADEWMMSEMVSPWSGGERGFVTERIWSQSGALLATCVQQGVVRLSPNSRSERL